MSTTEYQPRTAGRIIEILRAKDRNPRSWQREAIGEIKRLTKENEKLRDALGPFACLGRSELRSGDFNRARRALGIDRKK